MQNLDPLLESDKYQITNYKQIPIIKIQMIKTPMYRSSVLGYALPSIVIQSSM